MKTQRPRYKVCYTGIGSPGDVECLTLDFAVMIARRDRKPGHAAFIYRGSTCFAKITEAGELVYEKRSAA